MFVLISVCVDSEFCSKLSASFEKRNNADMSDLTSGKRYRNMTTGLLSKWNITLTLNTDVVSVFRTSRTGSLWPVYLTINELSSECRYAMKSRSNLSTYYAIS